MQVTLKRLVEHNAILHDSFGDSTYLLEPNIKSGHGGLRDYHTLLWHGRIISDIKSRKELDHYGFLAHEEYRNLEKNLTFIRDIRNKSFSLTAMAFQDVWNLDLARLKRCRVHVATRDRKLIPFCSYNILYRDGEK